VENCQWIDEMRTDENKRLRRETVAWVKSYCWETKRRHRDVWNHLYGLFERMTGERLPERKRLDWLESNGLIGVLYQATSHVR
jgi:hypothetical protein